MMNPRNPPLSPISLGGSEFSPSAYGDGSAYPSSNRGITSPPASVVGTNMNGFPAGARSTGGPSPPASIARTSYARSESGRSLRGEETEAVLSEHYVALRRYLTATSKDGRAQPPPNKARDKLLRLSSVQFLELSTDVFDELMRRQAYGRRPPNAPPTLGPPQSLLPEDTFHPKRNQARQKLSTLGPPRFRDLATDVFCELERRIPRFVSSDVPRMGSPGPRGPPSRSGTPSNGMPPRGMRRPSDASSIMSAGPPRMNGEYPPPPSPGMQPNGGYDRPMPKQFQSNTIVPNKSTMVEEDDDGSEDNDSFNPKHASKRSQSSNTLVESDKRVMDDYQNQVRNLREQLENTGDHLKRKEAEINDMINQERSRSTTETDTQQKEWETLRRELESKLDDSERLNATMRSEMDHMRNGHARELQDMEDRLAASSKAATTAPQSGGDLAKENEELRSALDEQQRVTEEARREARQFLQEMKALAQQHTPSWDRQTELENMVESLEKEVRDWRSRYARTKTQLRNLRTSSIGLTIEQDASKYLQEQGFLTDGGLVKDVHVTKFQISVDELLQGARNKAPEKVIDHMKGVVVNVRRIIKDIESSLSAGSELPQSQQKLKNRVSATANNLITASKNFAAAAGMSPVSLLDAAASHLVAAVVELLRTVKIRATPAGELEDDDDGTVTPVDSTGFFSNRSTTISNAGGDAAAVPGLAPLQPFQGMQGIRNSGVSSTYSPVSSPRQSANQYNARPLSRDNAPTTNGSGPYSAATNGYRAELNRNDLEELRLFISGQSDSLVQSIQTLVDFVRRDSPMEEIDAQINAVGDVVSNILYETEPVDRTDDIRDRLTTCRQRLYEAGDQGKDLSSRGLQAGDREWRMWTQTLPPIAFELARETKELMQRIDQLADGAAAEDFS
ncbi:protein SPA2 [Microdochium nivale]|nr:protein SPA2 [Microdochium nivale]